MLETLIVRGVTLKTNLVAALRAPALQHLAALRIDATFAFPGKITELIGLFGRKGGAQDVSFPRLTSLTLDVEGDHIKRVQEMITIRQGWFREGRVARLREACVNGIYYRSGL